VEKEVWGKKNAGGLNSGRHKEGKEQSGKREIKSVNSKLGKTLVPGPGRKMNWTMNSRRKGERKGIEGKLSEGRGTKGPKKGIGTNVRRAG